MSEKHNTTSNNTMSEQYTTDSQPVPENVQFTINIEEENLIYFNKFEWKQSLVDDELSKEAGDIFYKFVDDKLVIARGEDRAVVAEATWSFLGQFGDDEATPGLLGYYWIWAWHLADNPAHEKIKTVLKKLPESLQCLGNHNVIT